MRTLLIATLVASMAAATSAADEELSLESLQTRADVVVTGSFVAEPEPLKKRKRRTDVLRYEAEFRISKLLKGESTDDRRPGGTIRVLISQLAPEDGEPQIQWKPQMEYVLFLKHNARNSKRPYITVDPQLGMQPAIPPLTQHLARLGAPHAGLVPLQPRNPAPESIEAEAFDPLPLAVAHTEQLDIDPKRYKLDQGKAATYSPEKGPVRWLVTFETRRGGLPLQIAGVGRSQVWRIEPLKLQPHVTTHPPSFSDLTGRWRMMLPAGYEHHVTIASVGHDFHVLAPTHLNMGGILVRDNDRLVSIEEHGPKKERFVWELRSPYLLTLVGSTDAYGATYDHAILFRPKFPEGDSE
ncbi:hypothetical protein Mal4_55110 [Maioricimonas rarisocia]|uniref:Uncharacterized protein n=1 Tax=Maioricimonas rarisocia TaxID=2528026 RepID=A0A517ZFA2_9PLAN|nr:hypothetical protein [Maioricimonas rarisocia]QDU41146.1 hypothetical protein Mal4_55110 [Maioricimonas rarisocia]